MQHLSWKHLIMHPCVPVQSLNTILSGKLQDLYHFFDRINHQEKAANRIFNIPEMHKHILVIIHKDFIFLRSITNFWWKNAYFFYFILVEKSIEVCHLCSDHFMALHVLTLSLVLALSFFLWINIIQSAMVGRTTSLTYASQIHGHFANRMKLKLEGLYHQWPEKLLKQYNQTIYQLPPIMPFSCTSVLSPALFHSN